MLLKNFLQIYKYKTIIKPEIFINYVCMHISNNVDTYPEYEDS